MGTSEERREDIASGSVQLATASGDACTFVFPDLEVAEHLFLMGWMDERADDSFGIEGMPHLDPSCLFRDQSDEFIMNTVFNQQPRRRSAPLSIERVNHEHHCICCTFKICVGKNDHRIFAA